ncbi:hypothetical protein QR680_003449 [Steinernema hermaphroditum]|uniref:Uncharacterized protein n=1 Tax=Steinernema hermaphroditum TaxID=289476 RepID=A0AA39LK94_9BILA|nr:hypothetical protein QR680_003449 [Steinernema hermaphroditum]
METVPNLSLVTLLTLLTCTASTGIDELIYDSGSFQGDARCTGDCLQYPVYRETARAASENILVPTSASLDTAIQIALLDTSETETEPALSTQATEASYTAHGESTMPPSSVAELLASVDLTTSFVTSTRESSDDERINEPQNASPHNGFSISPLALLTTLRGDSNHISSPSSSSLMTLPATVPSSSLYRSTAFDVPVTDIPEPTDQGPSSEIANVRFPTIGSSLQHTSAALDILPTTMTLQQVTTSLPHPVTEIPRELSNITLLVTILDQLNYKAIADFKDGHGGSDVQFLFKQFLTNQKKIVEVISKM